MVPTCFSLRPSSGNLHFSLAKVTFIKTVGKTDQIEVRKFLLSFGAESFVFQFAIQKCKD